MESLVYNFDILYTIIFWGFSILFLYSVSRVHKSMGKKLYERQKAVNNYKTLKKIIYFYEDRV